jgi:putative nucleotidyltransferase with HDIG domain
MSNTMSLVDIIHEYLVSEELQLPVFHHVALRLQDMLAKDDYNLQQVATLIMEDQYLASQVLRVANSAFFSGLSKASTIKDAIVRLGAKQLLSIVMLATQKSNYHSQSKILNVYMQDLWKHALGCAMGAKWLAEKIGYSNLAQEAFLGGLLHDIGKLFLLKLLEDIHASDKYDVTLSKALVTEVLKSMHAEQGYTLLQKWNIPDLYCHIVRDHQKEAYNTSDVLLSMVRVVNLTCKKLGIGMQHDPSIILEATPEALHLGVSDLLLAELEIAIEDGLGLEC